MDGRQSYTQVRAELHPRHCPGKPGHSLALRPALDEVRIIKRIDTTAATAVLQYIGYVYSAAGMHTEEIRGGTASYK